MIVLVDRKIDGFQDEISPDIKKQAKMKSLISFFLFFIPGKFLDICTNFILESVRFSVNKYYQGQRV